jgi:hypothetical protein
MKFAHLKHHLQHPGYEIMEYNHIDFYILAGFLESAISSNLAYNYYTDWLTGKYDQEYAGGNAYGLREYNNRIYVFFQFDEEGKELSYFNTTKQKMLDIIYDWAILVSQNPPPSEIMITEENDIVTIKAIN